MRAGTRIATSHSVLAAARAGTGPVEHVLVVAQPDPLGRRQQVESVNEK